TDDYGNPFIHGLLRYEKPSEHGGDRYICEVKYLTPDHNLIGKTHYPVDFYHQTYTTSKLLPNMGLEGYNTSIGLDSMVKPVEFLRFIITWDGTEKVLWICFLSMLWVMPAYPIMKKPYYFLPSIIWI